MKVDNPCLLTPSFNPQLEFPSARPQTIHQSIKFCFVLFCLPIHLSKCSYLKKPYLHHVPCGKSQFFEIFVCILYFDWGRVSFSSIFLNFWTLWVSICNSLRATAFECTFFLINYSLIQKIKYVPIMQLSKSILLHLVCFKSMSYILIINLTNG